MFLVKDFSAILRSDKVISRSCVISIRDLHRIFKAEGMVSNVELSDSSLGCDRKVQLALNVRSLETCELYFDFWSARSSEVPNILVGPETVRFDEKKRSCGSEGKPKGRKTATI